MHESNLRLSKRRWENVSGPLLPVRDPLLFDSCRRPPSTTSDHFFKIFPYRAVAYVRLLWYQQKNPLGTKTSHPSLHQSCSRSYAEWWRNLAANVRIILSETSQLYQQEDNTPHTQTQNPPALIPTLKKNARQSQETELLRNNFSLLWSQNSWQDKGAINLAQISPHN